MIRGREKMPNIGDQGEDTNQVLKSSLLHIFWPRPLVIPTKQQPFFWGCCLVGIGVFSKKGLKGGLESKEAMWYLDFKSINCECL